MKALVALALGALMGMAQTFDVATVKPNSSDDRRVMIQFQPGGRFVATGVSLRMLITIAYDIREFQLSGGPAWINDDRYDINAKSEALETGGRPDMALIRKTMQNFLAERFGLKVKNETREGSVFHLVVAKDGHKLKPAEATSRDNQQIRMGRGQITASGIDMATLARQVGMEVQRPVIDKTDVAGLYVIDLRYTPEPRGGIAPPSPDALAGAGPSGPTIYTALQEQLGLKLESAKGPVPMLIVEAANKPTDN
jgi:bla regulator protein blaR1